MAGRAHVYRLTVQIYGQYISRDQIPECKNCGSELKVRDGIVAKRSGRNGKRALYCPLCALKKGVVLMPELENKLGPPDTWLNDAYNRIKNFDEKIKQLRTMEKK